MNEATLQAKIYSGYAQAALRIGKQATHYRPASATAPLTVHGSSLYASFAQNFDFAQPNKYGNATWKVLVDGSQTQPGDYLTTGDGTWFIAAQQPLLPIYAVNCNRVISVRRTTQTGTSGAVGYGGATAGNEQVLMSGWPASVLQGTKGEKNPANIPEDERMPWWVILVPAYTGIIIRTSDIIRDELNRKYSVSSAELTDLGWRITAALEVP